MALSFLSKNLKLSPLRKVKHPFMGQCKKVDNKVS